MPFDVFISHSSKDEEITRRIHDRLTEAGIETWVDFIDIQAGDVWRDKAQEALHSAKRGVIVLSKASLASTHCEGEWQTFVEHKLPIFVLQIEALTSKGIPCYLKPSQITDLTAGEEAGLTALITSMTKPQIEKKISGGFPKWHLDIPIYGREDDLNKVRAVLDGEKAPRSCRSRGSVGWARADWRRKSSTRRHTRAGRCGMTAARHR